MLPKVPKKSKEEKLAKLTQEQKAELERIERDAIADHEGSFFELESALGMLHVGHHVGWKVLYLIHSKSTVRKYEGILNIKIRDVFPEIGPSTYRANVYRLAQAFSNFWKVVSGDIKLPAREDKTHLSR